MVEIVGQDNRFEKSCGNCGAKLRFQKSDVRAGERLPHSHDDHKSVITCPQCRRPVDVTTPYGPSSAETYARQQRDDY